MIVLYTINSESKGEIIKTMLTNLKKKKIKQEFILLYCIDTKEVLKFTRHGKCDIVKTGIIPSIQV